MFTIQSLHIAFEIWGGIFCLIAAFCLWTGKAFQWENRRILLTLQLTVALLLFSDAVAWGYRGNAGTVGYLTVRISNFLVFITSDTILLLFHQWLCKNLFPASKQEQKRKQNPIRICMVQIIAFTGMVLVVISQFTDLYYYFDADNLYHRNVMYPLALVIPMLGMMLDLSLIVQYRKRVRKEIFLAMCSYIVLPMMATVVLIFYYGISLINMSIAVSAIFMFIATMMENNQILVKQDEELADMKIKVLLSQINPHFLLNALLTIQKLCKIDSEEAAETVGEFAKYLRGNLNSLNGTGLIPFERELEHVKTYLSIEQKRFGERVNVTWDIQEDGFLIPPLTLQPIVENAVKHGITRKENGGTVHIQTLREEHGFLIRVTDDGVGFDEAILCAEGREHIGIQNVTNRLAMMCDGRLTVHSKKNKGTTAEIYLPFEYKKSKITEKTIHERGRGTRYAKKE